MIVFKTVLFRPIFVKNTRQCTALPAFFASTEQKTTHFEIQSTSFIKSIRVISNFITLDYFYKISVFGYFISLLIELIYLAVPSEESQRALLKSDLNLWKSIKLVLGSLGILSFIFIIVYPFIDPTLVFNEMQFIGGMFLVWAGRFLTFFGSLDIHNHFKKDKSSLLMRGTFRYSRNPILLGLNITILGFLIAIGRTELFAISLFFYIGMRIKVIDEEKFLTQKYGELYLNYKKTTGRYL